MALAIIGKNLESFDLDSIDFEKPLDFDEVDVPGSTDLMELAHKLKLPFEKIHKLNPEIMRWITPPDAKTYKLRLPVGFRKKYAQCCSKKDLTLNLE